MIKYLLLFLFLSGFGYAQENPDGTYNEKYEPYATLIKEQKYLKQYTDIHTVSSEDQKQFSTDEVLVVKFVAENWNFSGNIYNQTSTEILDIKEMLKEAMDKTVGSNFNKIPNFEGRYKYVSTTQYERIVLIYFFISPNQGHTNIPDSLITIIKDAINPESPRAFGNFSIIRSHAQHYKMVEKNTVIEVALQLYRVKYAFGMDNENSVPYRNMTDQMIHLVGTRFENTFGEGYYRIIIYGFTKSRNSLIVHAAVLLDPDFENFYHASKIWYSVFGYVHLGKFPLLPGNVHIINSFYVHDRFHPYLSDRSYKRPLSAEFSDNPLIHITLPAFIIIGVTIVVIMLVIRFAHWFAIDRFDKDRLF